MRKALLFLAFSIPVFGQAPQIPLTGNIGTGGVFPLINSPSVVFATDANHTMIFPEMSGSSGFIKVTSTGSLTATRNLVAPMTKGFQFTIENATTGGQSIQVIGATGSGVTIPNGGVVQVASDGTNWVQVAPGTGMTALTGDVSATGPGSSAATLATTGVSAGSYTCVNETVDAKGRVLSIANGTCAGGISGLTAGFLPLAGSSTTLTANSHIDDGATTGSTITITEKVSINDGSGLGGGFDPTEGTAHTCTAGVDPIWADSTGHRMKLCNNGGSALSIPGVATAATAAHLAAFASNGIDLVDGGVAPTGTTVTIASGTSALGTSAIASGACATVVTTTATGVASTDAIGWNPNASIKAVTGYVPSTSGGLSIAGYPTTNAVNWDVCNWTSGSITPGAVTLNWRVTR